MPGWRRSVSRGVTRPLRSKWVGRSSPTSTPRWTSRPSGGSGTCLRHEWRGPQRRWRAADRDLRDTCSDLAQREHRRREISECAGCVRPAPKRRPLRAPRRTRRHADPLADPSRRHRHDPPQRHRHGDRRETVVPPWRDPTRHDDDDRTAGADDATIPPTQDPRSVRIRIGVRRAEDRAPTKSVTMQTQTTSGRSARSTASRTLPWTSSLG